MLEKVGRLKVLRWLYIFNRSLLIPPLPLLVGSVMASIGCARVGGVLLLGPLPLQLPEQIRRQQAVFHESIGQRARHGVCSTSRSSGASAAGQLMAAEGSVQASPASSGLQRVGHGRVTGSDQTGDIPDALLDDFIQFLLDLSNHGCVGEHVHEAVAGDMSQEEDS